MIVSSEYSKEELIYIEGEAIIYSEVKDQTKLPVSTPNSAEKIVVVAKKAPAKKIYKSKIYHYYSKTENIICRDKQEFPYSFSTVFSDVVITTSSFRNDNHKVFENQLVYINEKFEKLFAQKTYYNSQLHSFSFLEVFSIRPPPLSSLN